MLADRGLHPGSLDGWRSRPGSVVGVAVVVDPGLNRAHNGVVGAERRAWSWNNGPGPRHVALGRLCHYPES